jgi:tetratricopeptide (TPR) repeat protein
MRDRWVAVYLLVLGLQLPFYYGQGEGPLTFDFAAKGAEQQLRGGAFLPAEQAEVKESLDRAEAALVQMGDKSSRWARLNLNRGVLAWKQGKGLEAIEFLRTSRKTFSDSHGPDSFHVGALDLRIGELLFLRGQYEEALVELRRGAPVVSQYLGEHTPFPVRMVFREVSALVALSRNAEAADLAGRHLADLKSVMHEQDNQFLNQTGSALDALVSRGMLAGPGDGRDWKTYLSQQEYSESSVRMESP